MANERRLILGNGEKYKLNIEKPRHGGPKEYPYGFDEAKSRVQNQVNTALQKVASLSSKKRFGREAVLCIRLHPDFLAKSYDPIALFAKVPGLEKVGSRSYSIDPKEVAKTKAIQKQIAKEDSTVGGRLVFVKGTDQIYERMLRTLDGPIATNLQHEIQMIERFDLLSDEEQKLGFSTSWQQGRVEMVFHPSARSKTDHKDFLISLLNEFNVPEEQINIASYELGPTFISCWLNALALNAIVGTNPLRTIHPFQFRKIESLRGAMSSKSPLPPIEATRSTIKVGMFDGGVNLRHPLLASYVEHDQALSIKTPSDDDYVAHGNGVAGAILYGPLNGKDTQKPLPSPDVSVVSIRALPTKNLLDIDLYESIDVIEKAVPARQDVKWWNISFGPEGPILDDEISRFTYALDLLGATYGVTFCVAVGNDGESSEDRIQAPSDLVNGFGIGAYTYDKNGKAVHAPYSCKGPGREPGKIKPDLVDFGGCEDHPIHLVGLEPGKKILNAGTSFPSPRVASIGAQTTGRFDRGNTLLSRVLLVNSAKHPEEKLDHLLGYGIVPEVNDILYCDTNSVTIVYQDTINSSQFASIPIFLPKNLRGYKEANITWTIGVLSPIDPKNPTDYTSACIEDWFYPHTERYAFRPPKGSGAKSVILNIKSDALEVKKLTDEKWRRSDYPVADTGKYAIPERELRNDLKWETIARKSKTKMESSLFAPNLILHSNPRNGYVGPVDFAVAITVTLPKYSGDLYAQIRKEWGELIPIRLRTENELRIQI
jgi:hypothetical protein